MIQRQENIKTKKTKHNLNKTQGHDSRVMTLSDKETETHWESVFSTVALVSGPVYLKISETPPLWSFLSDNFSAWI